MHQKHEIFAWSFFQNIRRKFKLKKSYFQIISTFFRLLLFSKFEFDRTDNQCLQNILRIVAEKVCYITMEV